LGAPEYADQGEQIRQSKSSFQKRKPVRIQGIVKPLQTMAPKIKAGIAAQQSKENFKKKDMFGNDLTINA
jgi:hypothetical protein